MCYPYLKVSICFGWPSLHQTVHNFTCIFSLKLFFSSSEFYQNICLLPFSVSASLSPKCIIWFPHVLIFFFIVMQECLFFVQFRFNRTGHVDDRSVVISPSLIQQPRPTIYFVCLVTSMKHTFGCIYYELIENIFMLFVSQNGSYFCNDFSFVL